MATITFEGQTVTVGDYDEPICVETGIRCGRCSDRHENAKAVKLCYVIAAEMRAEQMAELAAEMRVERHFEDRGYWEHAAHDDWERSRGVVGFTEAWHIESPETCPCGNH